MYFFKNISNVGELLLNWPRSKLMVTRCSHEKWNHKSLHIIQFECPLMESMTTSYPSTAENLCLEGCFQSRIKNVSHKLLTTTVSPIPTSFNTSGKAGPKHITSISQKVPAPTNEHNSSFILGGSGSTCLVFTASGQQHLFSDQSLI